MAVAEINTEALRPYGFPSSYIPHPPEPKQQVYLLLDWVFEIMYGGQVGGGKSDALLMAALQYAEIPGYSALLLRRTFADLNKPGALLDRSKLWLNNTPASWNGNEKTWTFPSGAKLSFGYLRRDEDVYQYQSAEYQFVGFDEVTQFTRFQYTYMMSRVRRPDDDHLDLSRVPLRIRSATNPGGKGHEWCKSRFIIKDDPDVDDPDQVLFISSGLDDNPHIDGTSYRKALANLDPQTQKMLLQGDWDARAPGNWVLDDLWVQAAVDAATEWIEEGLITEPDGGYLSGCIDWGEHTQSYAIWPLEHGGIYVPPSETIGLHEDPATVAPRIIKNVTKFGYPVKSFRYDAAGIQSMRTFMGILKRPPYSGQPRLMSAKPGKVAFSSYKYETIGYLRLLFFRIALGEKHRVILIHPDNKELIRQLKIWERKDEESDQTTKEDDHGPDALVAGAAFIARANRLLVEAELERLRTRSSRKTITTT